MGGGVGEGGGVDDGVGEGGRVVVVWVRRRGGWWCGLGRKGG